MGNLKINNDNHVAKKVDEIQSKNEYTRVSDYKEAYCYGCFGKDVAFARLAHVCQDCYVKHGKEAILVHVKWDVYGFCNFCGKYKFNLHYVNIRVCPKCSRLIRNNVREYNKAGGHRAVDPFWQKLRRKYGKDLDYTYTSQLFGFNVDKYRKAI